ncbi:hypothetical protein Fmac_004917 [Flemingia macrophylla]|uniref:Uncharacterized protein n=1 Tax=Flemingia macrophylla TaxID=520843 RepID=A0ABD1N689_9FABA
MLQGQNIQQRYQRDQVWSQIIEIRSNRRNFCHKFSSKSDLSVFVQFCFFVFFFYLNL